MTNTNADNFQLYFFENKTEDRNIIVWSKITVALSEPVAIKSLVF
jgi:hypothetical protein